MAVCIFRVGERKRPKIYKVIFSIGVLTSRRRPEAEWRASIFITKSFFKVREKHFQNVRFQFYKDYLRPSANEYLWSQKLKPQAAEPGATANGVACHGMCSELHIPRQATPSLSFNVGQKNMTPVSKRTTIYIGYLWLLSSPLYFVDTEIQKRGFINSWPEILGIMIFYFGAGGMLYLTCRILNKEEAKNKRFKYFMIGSTIAAALCILGAIKK